MSNNKMKWVTYLIIGIMVLVFISPINFFDTGNDPVDYLLRTAYHANLTHLIVNMISFYYLSFIEVEIGWPLFIVAIVFIWIVSSMMLYFYHQFVPSQKVYTVGFSGVVFGLVVIYYFMMDIDRKPVFRDLFIGLVAQLFIPDISVAGHFFGIVAGFLFVGIFPELKNSLAGKGLATPKIPI